MAKTELGAALTVAHRETLIRLKAATLRDLLTLYPMWELDDPASYARLVAVIGMLVVARNANAASLAAAYYQAFRQAEKISGAMAPILAAPPSMELIQATVDVTAKAGVTRALTAGMPVKTAMQHGFVELSGAVDRLVLDGSRDTVLSTARKDPGARGFVRVTGAKPCAFCSMIASRGPVFWSAASAGFQAHGHCSCSAAPSFKGDQPTAQALAFRSQWNEATKGLSGTDALNAFRTALK